MSLYSHFGIPLPVDYSALSDDELWQIDPALKTQAEALVATVQQRALQRGVALPPPPELPVGCCGRGCSNCLWLFYYGTVRVWRDAALQAQGLVKP